MAIFASSGKTGETANELLECMRRVSLTIYSLQEGLSYIDEKGEKIQSNTVQQSFDNS